MMNIRICLICMRYFENSEMSECCGLSYKPPISSIHLIQKLEEQNKSDVLEQEKREYHAKMLLRWEKRMSKRLKKSFNKRREQAIKEISLLPLPIARENKRNYGNKLPDKLRNSVLKRDKHKCVECRNKEGLHVHHVVHRKYGGTDDMNNLQTLCDLCHAEKHRGERIYNLMVKSVLKQICV